MALNQILIKVAFIENITSKMASSYIHVFTIINSFNVKLHPHKAPRMIEVIWRPPAIGWLKCNTHGSFSTYFASYGGLFRNSSGDFVFGFDDKLDCSSSIQVELLGVTKAIDFASSFDWNNICLEINSSFVLLTIHDPKVVPWNVGTICLNCLVKIRLLRFHILIFTKKGNSVMIC